MSGKTIDPELEQIYWTQKGPDNAGLGRIFSCGREIPNGETTANRTDIELLFDDLPEPIDLELDVNSRVLYWTDRGDPPRGNTVNCASIDVGADRGDQPQVLLDHLMEGIGIALNLRGNRMFMTDFGGSLYSAKLDGTETNIAPCPGKPDRHCIRRIPLKGGLTMYYNKPIGRIAIVGTGLVGASWAAQYLARGFDVVATDPAPDAQMNLRGYIDESWKALTSLGLSAGASRDRLSFTKDMKEALTKADFVQENGPERPDSKIKLFADMDEMTPSDSIIASSSSGLTMSFIQAKCTHPERCLIGHPFNPPHILPLVEVVGGSKTSQAAIKQAMRFYKSIGKKPILLRREVPGHVANRLQSALYREVLYLIEQGVVSAADADDAVSWGPGLRWGVMGPSLQFHVGGGAGGIEHFMNHLFDPMVTLFKALGNPDITPNLKQTIAEGFVQEAADRCGGAREPRKRDTHRAS